MNREELVEYLQDRIRRHGLSRAVVARQIGVSPATISQILAGTYQGDGATVWPKIQGYRDLEEQRARYDIPTDEALFAETEQSAEISSVLGFCNIKKSIGVVYGAAGLGKSITARRYATTNNNVKIITCTAGQSIWTILDEIAELSKAEMKPRRELIRNIIRALSHSNMMFVFDEAQHLGTYDYEILRAIHDGAGVGLVFLGTASVYDRMSGTREKRYDQIYSRVGIQRGLRHVITKSDTKRVVGAHFPGAVFENDAIEEFHRIGNTHGGYRRVIKALDMATVLAKQNGREIPNAEDIRAAVVHLWQTAAN